MYRYTSPSSPALADAGRAAVQTASGGLVGVESELLEGKYLAQVKKTKALTVQLESERAKAHQLQQQLDAALAENATLHGNHQTRQGAAATATDGGGKAPAGLPSSLAKKLQLGTQAARNHRDNGVDSEGDTDNSSDQNDSGAESDAREQQRRRRLNQLKDRLAQAQALVRERDIQLREGRRDVCQLRVILGRELGKTPEELTAWLGGGGNSTGSRSSGNGTAASTVESLSGWKGRAEQIVLLRGKVKDLERVLQAYQRGSDVNAVGPLPVQAGTAASTRSSTTAAASNDNTMRNRLWLGMSDTDQHSCEEMSALIMDGGDDLESLMALARQTCPVPPPLATADAARRDASVVTTNTSRTSHPRRGNNAVSRAALSIPSAAHTMITGVTASIAPTSTARADVDDTARDVIANTASRHLKNLREVEMELATATAAMKEEKRKQSALQARLASLQRDNAQLRAHIAIVLEKSASDDELIAVYKSEVDEGRRMAQQLRAEVADLTFALEEGGGGGAAAGRRVEGDQGGTPLSLVRKEGQPLSAPDAAAGEGLQKANNELVERVRTLEALVANAASADGTESDIETSTRGSGAPVSYAARVVHWALGIAGAASPASSQPPVAAAKAGPAVSDLLRAAHGHVLRVERQLQQLEESHCVTSALCAQTQGGSSAAQLPQALLRENANLKERVKSLTDLLKKEARVSA